MPRIALFVHHAHPDAAPLAGRAAAALLAAGHTVRLPGADAALLGLDDHACAPAELVSGLDLAVSLGGDGTMLRAVDAVADAGVPVLGVNLGHLGYLTEVEPAQLDDALRRLAAGDYQVEERMRLSVEVVAASTSAPSGRWPALNEAVLGKTPGGQITRLRVTIDEEPFTTYSADGLIVATPTGSTAYAWSAGGPIISPRHAALVLAPVAPHMLFDRALVLPPDACVRIEVAEHRPADLSVDGRSLGQLLDGDAVVCTVSSVPARLVTFGPRSFLHILKAKFGLPER